jgi:hypothetical protein
MVLAPIDVNREAELHRLLASMNVAPGRVNPDNALVPFARFDMLHFARFVILHDKTIDDITVYGWPRPAYPMYLAFLGDVDGEADTFLNELATRAQPGLRTIFACCEGFAANADLVCWMKQHGQPSATNYVNWRGRTVHQVREEAALHDALVRYAKDNSAALAGQSPQQIRAVLRQFVDAERSAGRLTLSPENPTPLGWWLGNTLHLIGVPLLLLVFSPLLLVIAVVFLIRLRALEKSDPELCSRTSLQQIEALAAAEDHDVTNQFSAIGSFKPGLVRRWTATFILWLVEYTTRHVYTRGRLTRVHTIHFARWVFLDGKRRLLFASNYDASLESYMDDFINKVGFGLNAVFSNGVGYPRTNWLFLDGSKDEQKFKYFLHRHQVPTQVWYNSHPGLTAVDLERNTRIRQGLETRTLSDQAAREWASLI